MAPWERLYEVDGRRLMLHREGDGPSVVFLPGAGLVGFDFLEVQGRVAEFATAIVYDRAGTGWSDDVELPRGARDVVDELRALLAAAGVRGPHVLVGHSLGAFYARRYAQLHPDEVAGLLLLDPGHEDIEAYTPAEAVEMTKQAAPGELPDLNEEQIRAAREQLEQLYARWPEDVREALADHHVTEWRTGIREVENFESEIYAELRGGGDLPDVPLTVLTAGGTNPYWARYMPEDLLRESHEGLRALHAAIAAAVPRGEQRVIDGISHQYGHVERPDAVVSAVRDLLTRVWAPAP